YGAFHSSSLQTVLIEDGVEKLEEYCFRNCGSLSEVTIPGSVTWIGSMAFADCDNLESVTISGNCQVQLQAFEPFTEIRYYD
ncbi:MAG: leucine-rich repeat domain-containing protein, partial [Clostridium sp.]|nr:leucine-rich repeat domain-containing protein [Clostridium sp.]